MCVGEPKVFTMLVSIRVKACAGTAAIETGPHHDAAITIQNSMHRAIWCRRSFVLGLVPSYSMLMWTSILVFQ